MRFRLRSLMTLLIIVVLGFGIREALNWPLRASILVLTLGSVCWLLAVVQLFLELRSQHEAVSSGMDIEMSEDQELAKSPLQALDIWLWLIGCIVAIRLLGLFITIPLWTFLYALLHGTRWWLSLILAVICLVFLWGLFDYVLHVPFPDAVLPFERWLTGR
jgi:hypothetical protein